MSESDRRRRRSRAMARAAIVVALVCAGLCAVGRPLPAGAAAWGATTFPSAGNDTYTVPAGVDVVSVQAVGGGGGSGES